MSVQQEMLQVAYDSWVDEWSGGLDSRLFKPIDTCRVERAPDIVSHPYLLRTLEHDAMLNSANCVGLLESQLFLKNGEYEVGRSSCKDYFLCAEVADDDLPWDINELDW